MVQITEIKKEDDVTSEEATLEASLISQAEVMKKSAGELIHQAYKLKASTAIVKKEKNKEDFSSQSTSTTNDSDIEIVDVVSIIPWSDPFYWYSTIGSLENATEFQQMRARQSRKIEEERKI
jgi:hypothetical protein